MKAFGAELIEHGRDFDEARERAVEIAAERGYEYGKSFDRDLVLGVSTYAYELFTAEPELDAVYVPIGLGSGVCGVIAARDALKCKARVIGVISDRANTYRLSLDAGRLVPTNSALTFADGVAVRVPDEEALAIMQAGMERLIDVTDDEVAEAIRILYSDTHTLAEGAGAIAFAALMRERERMAGKRVGRDRVGAEHRPAVDADRAGGRNAGGGLTFRLVQARALEEPGAVARVHRHLEGAAVAVDEQRHVDAGIAERPHLAERGGKLAHLAARDRQDDVAGADLGRLRGAARARPTTTILSSISVA